MIANLERSGFTAGTPLVASNHIPPFIYPIRPLPCVLAVGVNLPPSEICSPVHGGLIANGCWFDSLTLDTIRRFAILAPF